MNTAIALECTQCGRTFPAGDGRHRCPDHGADGGVLDVQYDEAAVREDLAATLGEPIPDLWKYERYLPTDGAPVSLSAGGTPLLDAPRLSQKFGVTVRLKDETGNPTGSIKDRASAVLTSRALAAGREVVTCASTGNAAASLAGYAARAGLSCGIFVPDSVPEGKAVQPLVYGADVFAVDGAYDDAYDLCRSVAAERGWYDCSAAANPYAVEGLRTVGHELAEQTRGDVPDWVVVPMGNGCGVTACWKGLREFERLGFVEETPRLLGVQAEGASAIRDRFRGEPSSDGNTCADSLAVRDPHNAARACRTLEESAGDAVAVSDEAIIAAERTLGRTEGVYAEPASAATLAGLETALDEGIVAPGDSVALVVTGTGLKDTASARAGVEGVERVGSSPEAVPDISGRR